MQSTSPRGVTPTVDRSGAEKAGWDDCDAVVTAVGVLAGGDDSSIEQVGAQLFAQPQQVSSSMAQQRASS